MVHLLALVPIRGKIRKMIVSRKFSFDAAHFLPNYEGKCKNTHGHHWVGEVACNGLVDEDRGMVVDFVELKKFCDLIEAKFDHTLLNDTISNPTAENISKDIYDEFYMWCKARGLDFEYIRVWETEDSMVELRGGIDGLLS